MNLEQFLAAREHRRKQAWQPRRRCEPCRRPRSECCCALYRPFASTPEIVLLVHPYEARRAIATARLTHRCLANSRWIQGSFFQNDPDVDAILRDPTVAPSLLYPGRGAIDLETKEGRDCILVPGKRSVVFVLDGTWAQARRMRRLSTQLYGLPMVRFTPPRPSRFRVRKQPSEYCYSTIEAVHHLLDLFAPPGGPRPHDNLLEVFDAMVERQLFHRGRGVGRPSRAKREMLQGIEFSRQRGKEPR
jgi:DTW domain-containing protein YfiP